MSSCFNLVSISCEDLQQVSGEAQGKISSCEGLLEDFMFLLESFQNIWVQYVFVIFNDKYHEISSKAL